MSAKLLFISANPSGTALLDLDEEQRAIADEKQRAKFRDAYELVTMPAARIEDFRRSLADHAPRIVHFSGHGGRTPEGAPAVDPDRRDVAVASSAGDSEPVCHGELVVRDEEGRPLQMPIPAMKELFRLHRDRVRLVVLNACHTDALAEAIARHVDCVVGTSAAIADRAAIAFAHGFYAALFAGESVQHALELGRNEVRSKRAGDPEVFTLRCRDGIVPDEIHLGELLGPLTFHVLAELLLRAGTTSDDHLAPPPDRDLGDGARGLLATLQEAAITWERYLAAVALDHAPRALLRYAPRYANDLRCALAGFLKNPTVAAQNLPPPDHLFPARESSTRRVAAFFAALLAGTPALDARGVREGLKAAADEVIRVLDGNEPPAWRSRLSAMARFLIRHEPPGIDRVVTISKRAIYELLMSARSPTVESSPGLTLTLLEGQLAFIAEDLPKAETDHKLELLAAHYDEEFSSKTIDQISLFTALFIEPRVRFGDGDGDGSPLFHCVDRWLDSRPSVPLVLLGDPGSGKTSACQAIVHRQLERVREHAFSKQVPFPVLIPLRLLRRDCSVLGKKLSFELAQALREICVDQTRRWLGADAGSILANRQLLLVLDGFDELALAEDAAVQGFLNAVERLARDSTQVSILLTGRTFAFMPHFARMDLGASPEHRWLRATLQPFSVGPGSEVERFVLGYLVAAEREKVSAQILKLVAPGAPFAEVAQTPVLLAMLCAFYHRIGELRVIADRKVMPISILEWLVGQAVQWRANPGMKSRERLSDGEARARLAAYQSWAWQAFRCGGTDFAVSATGIPSDTWLVDFFVKPSEGNPGQASFVHRTIAEYLAAAHLVEGICHPVHDLSVCDAFLHRCQELAVEERILDGHFKELIGQSAALLSAPLLAKLKEAAEQLVGHAYDRPAVLGWRNTPARTLDTLGMIAELACTVLLGAGGGDIDGEVFRRAAKLRTASPRSKLPWQLGAPIKRLHDLDLSNTQLTDLDLTQCQIQRVVFAHASLLGSRLQGATIERCIFDRDALLAVNLANTTFVGCDFNRINLHDSLLFETLFVDCKFYDTQIELSSPFRAWISFDPELAKRFTGAIYWLGQDGLGWDYDREHDLFVIRCTAEVEVQLAADRHHEYELRIELRHEDTERIVLVEIVDLQDTQAESTGVTVKIEGALVQDELDRSASPLDRLLGTVPVFDDGEASPGSPTIAEQLLTHAKRILNQEIAGRMNHRFLAMQPSPPVPSGATIVHDRKAFSRTGPWWARETHSGVMRS